ncbi:hypothetical protein VYU27_007613 [Nannochloropsis oceanica]
MRSPDLLTPSPSRTPIIPTITMERAGCVERPLPVEAFQYTHQQPPPPPPPPPPLVTSRSTASTHAALSPKTTKVVVSPRRDGVHRPRPSCIPAFASDSLALEDFLETMRTPVVSPRKHIAVPSSPRTSFSECPLYETIDACSSNHFTVQEGQDTSPEASLLHTYALTTNSSSNNKCLSSPGRLPTFVVRIPDAAASSTVAGIRKEQPQQHLCSNSPGSLTSTIHHSFAPEERQHKDESTSSRSQSVSNNALGVRKQSSRRRFSTDSIGSDGSTTCSSSSSSSSSSNSRRRRREMEESQQRLISPADSTTTSCSGISTQCDETASGYGSAGLSSPSTGLWRPISKTFSSSSSSPASSPFSSSHYNRTFSRSPSPLPFQEQEQHEQQQHDGQTSARRSASNNSSISSSLSSSSSSSTSPCFSISSLSSSPNPASKQGPPQMPASHSSSCSSSLSTYSFQGCSPSDVFSADKEGDIMVLSAQDETQWLQAEEKGKRRKRERACSAQQQQKEEKEEEEKKEEEEEKEEERGEGRFGAAFIEKKTGQEQEDEQEQEEEKEEEEDPCLMKDAHGRVYLVLQPSEDEAEEEEGKEDAMDIEVSSSTSSTPFGVIDTSSSEQQQQLQQQQHGQRRPRKRRRSEDERLAFQEAAAAAAHFAAAARVAAAEAAKKKEDKKREAEEYASLSLETTDVDPKVYEINKRLHLRTVGERQLRVFWGPRGMPEFEGIGSPVVFPLLEELI